MAQQTINIGTSPNDGTGDSLRTAFGKTNDNDTELYAAIAGKADASAVTAALSGKIATSAIDVDAAMAADSDAKIASQKAVKTALGDKVNTSDIDADSTFAANSDAKVPSQKAVKAAIDAIKSAWAVTTPTPAAGSGSFTTASCTLRTKQVGGTVVMQFDIAITSNGTAAGYVKVALPVAAKAAYAVGSAREVNVTGAFVQGYLGNTTEMWIVNSSNAYPGGDGYRLVGSLTYEAA